MFKRLRLNFSSLFSLLLLTLCVWAIAYELREYNYQDILKSLAAIPKSRLSWAIWLTVLSYLVMVGYDVLGFHHIGRSLSWNKIALTSFISAAFTSTIGFALLTGSAIRYRFYASWGVSALAIAQVITFEHLTFWLGMFTVSGLIFLLNPLVIPSQLHLPFTTVRPIGVIFLVLIAIYLLCSLLIKRKVTIHNHELSFPNFHISLAQIILSSCDWILVAAVLYALIPSNTPLGFIEFLGIYLLGMFAGIVSNIPGALGVFETLLLLLLSSKVSTPTLLGSLIAYRGVYYLLPLLVAACLLGVFELRFSNRKPSKKS